MNRLKGVKVSVLRSSAVDHEFDLWSGQAKYNKNGICCISVNHAALRSKIKDWLAQIQKMYVIEATCLHEHCYFIVILSHRVNTIKIQLSTSS